MRLRPLGGVSVLLVIFSLAIFYEKIASPLQRGSEPLAKYDFLNGKTEAISSTLTYVIFSGRFDDPHRAGCTAGEFPSPTVMLVGDSFGGYLSVRGCALFERATI
jgi:hypothetical protein